MTGSVCLGELLLPLSRRTPPAPRFLRVIGYDRQGETLTCLKKIYALTRSQGLYIRDGIPNPTEPEIQRFYAAVGEHFALTPAVVAGHLTVWLGQLRPAQRAALASSVTETLELLSRQGANDNIRKNAYIKFMCWLRAPFGGALKGLGQDAPAKVIFEGAVSRYELLFLRLLHRAGCDVVYVDLVTEEPYTKAARGEDMSEPVYGEKRTPPPVHFTQPQDAPPRPGVPAGSAPSRPVPPPRPANTPPPPPPWAGLADTVMLNTWAEGASPIWEVALLPCAKRGPGKLCAVFSVCIGAEERPEYRNRLFRLKRSLEGSSKKWLLVEGKVPNPTNDEAAAFRAIEKSAPRPVLIRALADKLTPACGRVQVLLAQRAFALVMEQCPEQDPVRLYNYGVRLACWLKRYVETLFERYQAQDQPALLYYGPVTSPEISLLWGLARTGVDVLYFCPARPAAREFGQHFLPSDWQETNLEQDLPVEPFPQREERLRAGTTAYQASRELDELLYSDTGMFRDRQFARSQPVTLKTTYDEVGQLWREEAQYRPSFRAEDGVVYVPNLFSKVCGVDKGDLDLYWERIREMVTESTCLAAAVPFLQVSGPSMSIPQARSFLHGGRLDPKALKASRAYRYGYLPDDTQDYILEKIQALIDYDLIVGGGEDQPAAILSALMNLEKDLLRLLQNFDFTREVPKFLVVDVTENMFSLNECILLAFLNLVGFDVAVFTPTGYRNLEEHLRPDSFDTLTAGEYQFDLTVPDLRAKRAGAAAGGWFGRLFGGERT